MRVLTLTPELPRPDGPNTMAPAARQIESLSAAGIDMRVLEVTGIPVVKYAQKAIVQRRYLDSADLIHAHYGYCGWLARSQFKKPIVVSFMGSDVLGTVRSDERISPFSRIMVQSHRRLARMVNAVIVKSKEMADVLAPARAHIIPNGVDTDRFAPLDRDQARRELGWKPAAKYVLFPGNPNDPRKGYRWARAAVDYAQKSIQDPIEIAVLKRVSPEQVPLYMNASDMMLMVSLHEGSPNVVKEAMACDVPIVGVPVGDVSELLRGVEGCTVCSREVEPLGRAIVDTLSSGNHAEGREGIRKRSLDLESVANRIINVFEGALRT